MDLSKSQLNILRHMLGINTPDDRIPKPYRNYYAADSGDKELEELERIGAIEKYFRDSNYIYYQCTESGKLAAMRSHRYIRHTKAQRRYSKFLDLCDCYPDLTFHEFLTNPEFKEIRKNC